MLTDDNNLRQSLSLGGRLVPLVDKCTHLGLKLTTDLDAKSLHCVKLSRKNRTTPAISGLSSSIFSHATEDYTGSCNAGSPLLG